MLLLLLMSTMAVMLPLAVLVATVGAGILLGANLVAYSTHLVEAAFGAVSYYDLPSSEELLLAQAYGRVADASALGVVFGRVELVHHFGLGVHCEMIF